MPRTIELRVFLLFVDTRGKEEGGKIPILNNSILYFRFPPRSKEKGGIGILSSLWEISVHAPAYHSIHAPTTTQTCFLQATNLRRRRRRRRTLQSALLKMLKSLVLKASSKHNLLYLIQFKQQRGLHNRNKMAMEYIAKGWNALKEVDRVIDYCEPRDKRLIPHLKTAKDNFEMALEVDNSNTHARYWLSRLHLKYHVPGQCKAIGAALLVEAADMGDADAQYELGRNLRIENEGVDTDQQAFYYLEKAADQLQPDALYLLGAVYLTGDCVKKDIASALWCFHRASEKGHAGAAIACGSLLLRGYEPPTSITKFNLKNGLPSWKPRKKTSEPKPNPIELAREQFENAAKLGNDLGFRWLKRIEEEEKRLLAA